MLFGSPGSSGCNGAALTTYEWDFGDGATDNGTAAKASVSHTYAAKGTYTVKLHVIDTNGADGRTSYSLGVGVATTGNPTITCPMTVTGQVGRPITFSSSGADPQMQTLTYQWTFSDSTMASGSVVQKTFATAGSFTGSVVATAADNRMSTPCVTTATVAMPATYTGTWLLNPTSGGGLTGCTNFSTAFPATFLSIYHEVFTDGGTRITATPSGGSFPAGNALVGDEDLPTNPGTFRIRASPGAVSKPSCPNILPEHSVKLVFSSPTAIGTGSTWTIVYTAPCVGSGCPASCGCVESATFTGVKQCARDRQPGDLSAENVDQLRRHAGIVHQPVDLMPLLEVRLRPVRRPHQRARRVGHDELLMRDLLGLVEVHGHSALRQPRGRRLDSPS